MRKLLIICFLIGSKSVLSQEDIKLSTHGSWQHVLYAPSLAIAHQDINVTALFRKQWSVSGAPTTGFVSAHSQLNGSNTFISGYVGFERISVYDKTSSEVGITQRIKVNEKNFIGAGVAVGFNALRVDLSRANFSSGDDLIGSQIINTNDLILTPSISWINTSFKSNLSLGMRDVLGTKNLFGYFSKLFVLNDKFGLDASILSKYSVNTEKVEVGLTALLTYDNMFSLGITGRNQNQVVGLFQFNLKDKFKVGYAYDHHFGSLNGFNSHEIVLRLRIPGKTSGNLKKLGFTNPRI